MPYCDGEYIESSDFSTLKGKVLKEVRVEKDEVFFVTDKGEEFKLFHSQDCCESVSVEEVIGDTKDLIGAAILLAEEVSSTEPDEAALAQRKAEYEKEKAEYEKDGREFYYSSFESYTESRYESETWTFYKLSTIKGSVTIRFYGSSNGYYSESVDFVQLKGAS